jgi:hypothetical protein
MVLMMQHQSMIFPEMYILKSFPFFPLLSSALFQSFPNNGKPIVTKKNFGNHFSNQNVESEVLVVILINNSFLMPFKEASNSVHGKYRTVFMNTFAKDIYRTTLSRKQGVLEAGIGAAMLYKNYARYLNYNHLTNVQKVIRRLFSSILK